MNLTAPVTRLVRVSCPSIGLQVTITSYTPPMTPGMRNIQYGLSIPFPDSGLVGNTLAVLKESILSGRW